MKNTRTILIIIHSATQVVDLLYALAPAVSLAPLVGGKICCHELTSARAINAIFVLMEKRVTSAENTNQPPPLFGGAKEKRDMSEEMKLILRKMGDLATGKMPKDFVENGDNLWTAFALGRAYSIDKVAALETHIVVLKAQLTNITEIGNAAQALGRMKSDAKAAASRENGKLGGRPRKVREVKNED